VTGEEIDGSESSAARRIVLTFDIDEVQNDVLSKYQKFDIWPTVIYSIIQFLQANSDWSISTIKNIVEAERFIQRFKLPRRNEQYAVLCAVLELILEFGRTSQAITETQKNEWRVLLRNDIQQILLLNDRMTQNLNPALLAMRALEEEVLAGNVGVSNCYDPDVRKINQNQEYFIIDGKYLREISRRYCEREGIAVADKSTDTLSKDLARAGLLLVTVETSADGKTRNRYEHKMPRTNSSHRYYFIDKEQFEVYIQENR